MPEHLTRNILIYSQSPVLPQLLKQHLPGHYHLFTHYPSTSSFYDLALVHIRNHTEALEIAATLPFGVFPHLILLTEKEKPLFPSYPTLAKPLRLQQLIGRISQLFIPNGHILILPNHYTLFLATRHLQCGNTVIPLTEKEVALLKYLHEKGGDVANRSELLQAIWGYGENIDTHTVETHIYRLRQKTGETAPLILTEENGYRLATTLKKPLT